MAEINYDNLQVEAGYEETGKSFINDIKESGIIPEKAQALLNKQIESVKELNTFKKEFEEKKVKFGELEKVNEEYVKLNKQISDVKTSHENKLKSWDEERIKLLGDDPINKNIELNNTLDKVFGEDKEKIIQSLKAEGLTNNPALTKILLKLNDFINPKKIVGQASSGENYIHPAHKMFPNDVQQAN
jgi:hypothetical protein